MTQDFSELPIGWEVAAVDARADFAESPKLYGPKPYRERFASKDLADARKLQLQSRGMIASVTPVFVVKAKQKALRERQTDLGFPAADGPLRLTE